MHSGSIKTLLRLRSHVLYFLHSKKYIKGQIFLKTVLEFKFYNYFSIDRVIRTQTFFGINHSKLEISFFIIDSLQLQQKAEIERFYFK